MQAHGYLAYNIVLILAEICLAISCSLSMQSVVGIHICGPLGWTFITDVGIREWSWKDCEGAVISWGPG